MTNRLKLTLLTAAAITAVSVGAASAMPFNHNKISAALGENDVQNVRVVCNHNGRCYNTQRNYRAYRYAPGYNSYVYGPGYDSGYAGYEGEYYGQPAYGYYGQPAYGYYGQPAYGYYGGPRVGIGLGPFGFVGF